jgi:hypothetical protein
MVSPLLVVTDTVTSKEMIQRPDCHEAYREPQYRSGRCIDARDEIVIGYAAPYAEVIGRKPSGTLERQIAQKDLGRFGTRRDCVPRP